MAPAGGGAQRIIERERKGIKDQLDLPTGLALVHFCFFLGINGGEMLYGTVSFEISAAPSTGLAGLHSVLVQTKFKWCGFLGNLTLCAIVIRL